MSRPQKIITHETVKDLPIYECMYDGSIVFIGQYGDYSGNVEKIGPALNPESPTIYQIAALAIEIRKINPVNTKLEFNSEINIVFDLIKSITRRYKSIHGSAIYNERISINNKSQNTVIDIEELLAITGMKTKKNLMRRILAVPDIHDDIKAKISIEKLAKTPATETSNKNKSNRTIGKSGLLPIYAIIGLIEGHLTPIF